MIEKKMKKPGKISLVLMSLLLIVLLLVNIIGGKYYNVITQYFSVVEIDEEKMGEVVGHAKTVVEQIAGEGVVMLENRDSTLPLSPYNSREKRVNLFGWSSVETVNSGGIGSASGNSDSLLDLIDGLENNGFEVNQELVDFYKGQDFTRGIENSWGEFDVILHKPDVKISDYSPELLNNSKDFSDVAIVVFSRLGTEMEDLPLDMSELGGDADEHYLELGKEEEAILDKVISMDFKKVIVLINSSLTMELGFLEEKDIDAALWIGGPGQSGMNSIAKILKGEINPSGRLADTYAYDLTSAPSMQNFGKFVYSDLTYEAVDYFGQPEIRDYPYVNFAEGIYVGYRYYETVFIDNETGESNEDAYNKLVQYPFGYGMSYTKFEQKISDFSYNEKSVTMRVNVTNTGTVSGKEVVQVYLTAPYTIGGIEKSHVSLIGFDKTDLLEPGETEQVVITFDIEDMASFDYVNNGCYVLDKGTYEIKLMSNAHDIVDSRDIVIDDTIIYNENNKRDSDKIAAVERFEDAQADVVFLSRADWEGTYPKDVPREKVASKEVESTLRNKGPQQHLVDENAEDIVIRNNGLKLEDMIGLDYNDPKWDLLLEQLSVKDMQKLIGLGGFATQSIASVDKPHTVDLDGPTGIFALVNEYSYDAFAYPSAPVIGNTWNKELALEMGDIFGKEATEWGVSGLYGPSMNMHRTPFNGRNFEYYSEDGLLSGKMASNIVKGLRSNNVYSYIKHFAMYEQTSHAFGQDVRANEQAMREIYFKPFEICVKEGGAYAVMSSYNRIGGTWTGGNAALLTDVLRNEWGFEGMVISDWFMPGFMNMDQGMYAGNDMALATVSGNEPLDTSNAGKQAMRRASHNILYTVANSNAMELGKTSMIPYWLITLIVLDILTLIGSVLYTMNRIKKVEAWRVEKSVVSAVS